jgi:CPA1 family monovalent cation:H+ antiporter
MGATVSPFDVTAGFLALIAAVGWLNSRLLRLPVGVAMVLAGTLGAAALLGLRAMGALPDLAAPFLGVLRVLDFPRTVLGYLLAFLLFAGAMQVDLAEMRRRRLAVWSLATLGVVASTALVGGGLWLAAQVLSLPLPLAWAMVFGALISPTDPIAVLAVVRTGDLSKRLQVVLQGEALFNDGIGIVVFLAAVAVAGDGGAVHPMEAVLRVAVQGGGGLAFGLAAAFLAVRAMRAIDDYAVEVAITVALAMGAYSAAQALGFSGAIAVVAAGLIVGESAEGSTMSETTRLHVHGFWTLIDDILNALLFLLLGLQLAVVSLQPRHAGLWLAALVLTLATRLVVVAPWGAFFGLRHAERGATAILAWGGLHGALSLALALSVPASAARPLILSTTFVVVLFSVVAQGLTFPWLVRRVGAAPPGELPRGAGPRNVFRRIGVDRPGAANSLPSTNDSRERDHEADEFRSPRRDGPQLGALGPGGPARHAQPHRAGDAQGRGRDRAVGQAVQPRPQLRQGRTPAGHGRPVQPQGLCH